MFAAAYAGTCHPFAPQCPVLRRLAPGWLVRPPVALGAPKLPCPTEWPAAPSRSQTAFHRDVPTARAPCVTKNVCFVAPFRRPIPRATAGAIMGRFTKSAICAIPVFAARSYDQRVWSTDFCAEAFRWSD